MGVYALKCISYKTLSRYRISEKLFSQKFNRAYKNFTTTKMGKNESDGGECRRGLRAYVPCISSSMKTWVAVLLAILFFVVAYAGTYNLTNGVAQCIGFSGYLCAPGCPNLIGTVVHAILFGLLVRLFLW